VADALNRKVHNLHASAISMYRNDIKDRILEAANEDLQYRDLVAKRCRSIANSSSEPARKRRTAGQATPILKMLWDCCAILNEVI
jgi:hypothetical protein